MFRGAGRLDLETRLGQSQRETRHLKVWGPCGVQPGSQTRNGARRHVAESPVDARALLPPVRLLKTGFGGNLSMMRLRYLVPVLGLVTSSFAAVACSTDGSTGDGDGGAGGAAPTPTP